MKKALKIILSTISVLIILGVTVPIVLSMLLQVGAIQNFITNKVTEKLSEKAETTMSVSRINIDFFTKLVLDDVYIEDHKGDTLIYVKKLKVGIDGINFMTGKISLGVVDVLEGQCNLYKGDDGIMNIQKVFDHFKPEVEPTDPPNFRMTAREVNLDNFRFRLDDSTVEKQDHGINFKQLDLTKLYFQARDLAIFNYDILVRFEHLTFHDRSGFYLQHLASPRCVVNESGMRFEKLRLETQRSLLQFGHIYLLYDTWYAYNDFVNDVTIDVDIKPSRLSYRTLSYFTRQQNLIPTTIELSGRVRGTIPNLHGFFSKVATQNTSLSTEFSVVGLPDISNTRFNLTLNNLTTTAKDVESIYSEFTNKSLEGVYPILERSGEINVNGTFEGLLTQFMATATINTAQGTMDASLNVIPRHGKNTKMVGRFITNGYNLGATLGIKDLQRITCDANVDIETAGINNTTVTANASIPLLQFAGYDYKNLAIDGRFIGKTYEGKIKLDDPSCKFETEGFFDLTDEIPVYDFKMDLRRADLHALGLNERDSISILSANFISSGSGSKLDNLNGETTINRLTYVNHMDSVSAGLITLRAENGDTLKKMTFDSDFASIKLTGTNSYSEILRYLSQTVKKYIPAYPEAEEIVTGTKTPKKKVAEPLDFTNGSYRISVDVKRANNVASIFVPGLQLATGTNLDFNFNPKEDKFHFSLDSEFIGTDTEYIYKVSMKSNNDIDSIIVFNMNVAECEVAGLYMPNFALNGKVKNNMMKAGVSFDNSADGSGADIQTTMSIYRTEQNLPQIKVALDKSFIALERGRWDISQSHAIFDSTGIAIHNFQINHNEQKLSINGRLGKSLKDSLNVRIDQFNISPASMLVSDLGYKVDGRLSGKATGFALMGDMVFDAKLNLDSLYLNQHLIGNPVILSNWNPKLKRVDFSILESETTTTKPINGYYDLRKKDYKIDIKFPNFDMVFIEPLLKGILSNTVGSADVDLTLTGAKGGPSLNGDIKIKDYALTVDYTKARYYLKEGGTVSVANSCFKTTKIPITDNLKGHGSLVSANLDSDYFKNIRFGVNIEFEDLLALNTTIEDNDVFYGKAYGTGNFAVNGNERKTSLNINARTVLASKFFLPFSGIASIEEANFITFVDPEDKGKSKEQPRKFFKQAQTRARYSSELDINIDLNVTQSTEAQITMASNYMGNKLMGNTIKGEGNGTFNMHINPEQNIFTMNGNYYISKGKYIFEFYSLFDKEVVINPNSSISWRGDPADPEFNIDATYKTKASMAPLTPSGNELNKSGNSSSVTNLNCGVKLTGTMSAPKMAFDITAPLADPEKQSLLRNVLNTEEMIHSQFFSLVLTGAFIPDSGAGSMASMGTSLATATVSEFLSKQISNMISNDRIDIRFGYRPKTDFTSDELNLGIETDLIPNKLTLEVGGNYNTKNNSAYDGNIAPFSGDAYLTWIMNKAGTMRLQGFSRVIETLDEKQGLQETGVGISFRQDFQNFAEFRQKWQLWNDSRRKKKLEAKKAEKADTTKVTDRDAEKAAKADTTKVIDRDAERTVKDSTGNEKSKHL